MAAAAAPVLSHQHRPQPNTAAPQIAMLLYDEAAGAAAAAAAAAATAAAANNSN